MMEVSFLIFLVILGLGVYFLWMIRLELKEIWNTVVLCRAEVRQILGELKKDSSN